MNSYSINTRTLASAFFLLLSSASIASIASGEHSIETDYTISKVRSSVAVNGSYIVASSYEGTLLGISYSGETLWKNTLSGYMNHDLWSEDITGDGIDEIFAANADGTLYALNSKGKLLWKFKKNDAPMYSVAVIKKGDDFYIAAGGYDKSFYYLSANGDLIKEVKSSTYSVQKTWGKAGSNIPPKNTHTINFLRKIRLANGNQALAVHGAIHTMSTPGVVYLFEPLAEQPFHTVTSPAAGVVGELKIVDRDGDGVDEMLFGSSTMIQSSILSILEPETDKKGRFEVNSLANKMDKFGYRVLHPEIIGNGDSYQYLMLFGSRIVLVPPSLDSNEAEVLVNKYAYNDMWKDPSNDKIILASSQSGGSAIHVLDTQDPGWKDSYQNLNPPGKIAQILSNTATIRSNLVNFKRPAWERTPLPVYLMTTSISRVESIADNIKQNYSSPIFLNTTWRTHVEDWDRAAITSEKYRERRDTRVKYDLTSEEVLAAILPEFENQPGLAFWGGHGNDPLRYSLKTLKAVYDGAKGKKTVLIYPELESHDEGFASVLDGHIYPLAKYAQGRNGNIYVRTKHAFWQSIAHMPMWSGLMSGEFADVFVPSMEETSDKSMELSVAARMGTWMSGAVDDWGSRSARDNPSFDRMRQYSHQMLPNHFLRQMVYNISSGARYINNFPVDQQYISLLWELIAKGALYVPKRNEIVSISPVHLSMIEPDEYYLNEGNNVKWTGFYDEKTEQANPLVFSRLNGTWPGAPVTEWDFSRYAAGVNERRLNFLPPYSNGTVLITPVQNGALAADNPPRGTMKDKLHPIYRNIMKEYITDGRNYYSADGRNTYSADEYYKTIEADIKASAKLLPMTVSGDVAWVAAKTSNNHLRLTLIDSGYINPKTRTATVTFHTVKPIKMVDVLDGEAFDLSNPAAVKVKIPTGSFRFIDIEIWNSQTCPVEP